MDKKKLFLFILVAAVILIILLFGISSCEPSRNKVLETEDEIYTAFINANIDFTCKVLKDPTILEAENSKDLLNQSFAKFYLPVDDDKTMVELLQRYESDVEVISTVKINTAACVEGGEAIPYSPATNSQNELE